MIVGSVATSIFKSTFNFSPEGGAVIKLMWCCQDIATMVPAKLCASIISACREIEHFLFGVFTSAFIVLNIGNPFTLFCKDWTVDDQNKLWQRIDKHHRHRNEEIQANLFKMAKGEA